MANLDGLRAETPDGSLPRYAWPGAYPIVYVTGDGLIVCADCADEDTSDPVVDADILWEGPDYPCDDCGKLIESAYGDPEEATA